MKNTYEWLWVEINLYPIFGFEKYKNLFRMFDFLSS